MEYLSGGGVEGGDVYQLTLRSTESRCCDRADRDVPDRGVVFPSAWRSWSGPVGSGVSGPVQTPLFAVL